MTLALSIVHPGLITYNWHESVLKTLRARSGTALISVESGALISRARNQVLELFLGTEATHLLSTDSDMSWEPEAIDRLLEVNAPIVSGAYYGTASNQVFPVVSQLKDGALARPADFEELGEDPVEVFGVGMGFCLIRRDVVEALAPIRKLWPYAEVDFSDEEALGEDLTFCMRAAEKGFPTLIHPGVRVGHRKSVVI